MVLGHIYHGKTSSLELPDCALLFFLLAGVEKGSGDMHVVSTGLQHHPKKIVR